MKRLEYSPTLGIRRFYLTKKLIIEWDRHGVELSRIRPYSYIGFFYVWTVALAFHPLQVLILRQGTNTRRS